MSLCFHIIYTPGTIKPLQLLLHSLLKWSDCTFRLVANGCPAAERNALQRLCATSSRLAYVTLPTQTVMRHGEALNHLQAQNQADYFCFMDSDIYAVGEFLPAFLPNMGHYQAIFSAMPLRYPQTGWIMPAGRAFMAGPFTHTEHGLCLGTTFFALYDNAVLTELRRSTGIGFTPYHWAEIPVPYQQQLAALGLQCQRYDTAKLLNLVLHLHGHPLHYQPCAALRHIEAISRFAVIRQRPWWVRLRAYGGQWRRKLAGQEVKQSYDEALPYLSKLLWALADNQPVPTLPATANTESNAWVAQAWQELVALQGEFGKL